MTEKQKRPAVDSKSFELAEHFLSSLEGDEASEDQKWELAAVIQEAVEGWFENGHECDWLDSVEGPEVTGQHCRVCGADKNYSE
jgi:hypothetical protein